MTHQTLSLEKYWKLFSATVTDFGFSHFFRCKKVLKYFFQMQGSSAENYFLRVTIRTCRGQIGSRGERGQWLFYFVESYYCDGIQVGAFRGKNLSQLIIPIELCMSSKLFYKVSFKYCKTNNVLMVNSRWYGRFCVEKLVALCTFLKFPTHLEENLA